MVDGEQPKVAVVGTSIGCKLHVRALRGAGFEVTALVGQDKDRTRQRADHFGILEASTSFDAILDTDLDAVVVATPPTTHYSFTMKALAAGKHVLCEKPFALNISEAREMRDPARDAALVGQVNHPHRWFAHRAAFVSWSTLANWVPSSRPASFLIIPCSPMGCMTLRAGGWTALLVVGGSVTPVAMGLILLGLCSETWLQ